MDVRSEIENQRISISCGCPLFDLYREIRCVEIAQTLMCIAHAVKFDRPNGGMVRMCRLFYFRH